MHILRFLWRTVSLYLLILFVYIFLLLILHFSVSIWYWIIIGNTKWSHAPWSNNGHSEKFTCVLLEAKGCLLSLHSLYLAICIHMSLANILIPRKKKWNIIYYKKSHYCAIWLKYDNRKSQSHLWKKCMKLEKCFLNCWAMMEQILLQHFDF